MMVSFVSAAPPFVDQMLQRLSVAERYVHTPSLIAGVLDFCLAAAFFALSRAAPDFRVFRTTSAYYFSIGLEQLWQYHGGQGSSWVLRVVGIYFLVEMAAETLGIRRYRWTLLLIPVYVATLALGWTERFAFVQEWPLPFSAVALAILIVQGFMHGNRRDRLIASALLIHSVARLTAMTWVQRFFGIHPYFSIGAWHWPYVSISQTILGLLTLGIFVRVLVADRSEKQRMSSELAAGRAVQQVLVTESMPTVQGFEIHTAYKPYGEVGGDFYQVVPQPDGAVLVAIGDVSGKGIGAAMIVSLVVGTLQTLAETVSDPGQLLAALNRRVVGRSAGGFTTCLILRCDQQGVVTIANAGHIPPYLNGCEIMLSNGLPLGLIADAEYLEARLQLTAGSRLTLVTDGVVESRDKSGALLGFERTARLSRNTADWIVESAREFGQDDDITALTIAWVPVQRRAEPLTA